MAASQYDRLFPNVSFGDGIQIIGIETTRIGHGSCIGDGSWLNDCVRDGVTRLVIGERVLVGRRAVVSTAGMLEIGDFCLLAPDCFVSDADHVNDDIYQPVLQQGATFGRSVTIEENCWLGIGARVFGDVVVGRGSVVAAGSIVRSSVPPFCVVAGTPARVVKIYDFDTNTWVSAKNTEEAERILEGRDQAPPPARDVYKAKLHENNRLGPLGRELAGAGLSF